MAWTFIAHRGTANNKVSGTTVSVSPTVAIPVAAVVIVRATSDNLSNLAGDQLNHTVTDSVGNLWTKIREENFPAGAALGVTSSLWISQLHVALPTSSSVTLTISSVVDAKVISLVEFALDQGSGPEIVATAGTTGTSTTPSVTLSNLVRDQYLYLGAVGIEGPNGDAFTQDVDYLDNASDGTTGGNALTNVAHRIGRRIPATTTVEDTYNPTLGTSRDWVAILAAIRESGVEPFAPKRRGRFMWAELDIPLAPRQGQLSFAELEVPSATRRGQVSWVETEVPIGPRRGQLSWAELELPLAPRRGQVSWAELENPLGPRRGQVSWAEGEVPLAPRRAALGWTEFELPLAPRRGQASWFEIETPSGVERRVQVAWTELEVPFAPRRGTLSWAELEAPSSQRQGQLSQFEFETPFAPRRVQTSWVELETPLGARRVQVSWAELEVPILGLQPRRARVSGFYLQVPVFQRIRFAAVRTIFTLDAQRLNLLPLDIASIIFCTDTRRVYFYNPEDDTFNQVII